VQQAEVTAQPSNQGHQRGATMGAQEPARRNVVALFNQRVADSRDQIALRRKQGGIWQGTTFRDWQRAAQEIAGGLCALGVAVGDRVVLLASTRQEWVECELGTLMAGAVTVPIYPSSTADQCEYIISDCGASLIFAEDPHQLEKLLAPQVRGKLQAVKKVIVMSDIAHLERPDAHGRTTVNLSDVLPEGSADREWVLALSELRTAGQAWLEQNSGALDRIEAAIEPDHLFTIVYTSGTTGPPKGVVLTHASAVFESTALLDELGLGVEDEQLLFLPLAHIFARMLEWLSITLGARIAFAEGLAQVIQNMQEIRPSFMGAVPRVYEKAYVKITSGLEEKRKKPITRLLIDWALRQGARRSELEQKGLPATGWAIRLADKLVFKKVQDTFGGRLKFFVSGGAPLAQEIAEFFHRAGVLIIEGYGLTETAAATHCNRPRDYKFGTVGKPIPGVEAKLAADGEILVRGPNIMREYYGKPDATAEVLEPDGWFHTGDIGEIDDQGCLRITDRKKDIIVTAGGKNVAPQNLEGQLKATCPYISQVMVHGDKRKFLSALITLNEESITSWAAGNGISSAELAELAREPKVRALIQGYIDRLNSQLPSFESIKKFQILDRDLSQEEGELTPTMKVKRKVVSEKFKDILDEFYGGGPSSR
jgi:long-chain acyl-CoA synthetase